MLRKLLYLTAVLIIGFVAACDDGGGASGSASTASAKDDSPVLAVVNGEGITLNDFKREVSKLPPSTVQLLADEKNRDMLLERMINRKLLVQAGNEQGLNRDPLVVAHVNRIRDDKVMSLYIKQEVFDKSDVTDTDVKDYFDMNKEKLGQVRLSHILVENEAAAEEVLLKYKNGESFYSLARSYSIDKDTKNKGGDIGFVSWSDLADSPELREEAFSLEPGAVSTVVLTPYGYHVLKVTDVKPAADADYDSVKGPLKDFLTAKKAENLFDSSIESLKRTAEIKKNEPSINELSFLNLAELAAPPDAEEPVPGR